MENKKIIASFELTVMIVSLFAFSYGVAMTDEIFVGIDEKYEEMKAERLVSLENYVPQKSAISIILGTIFGKLKSPMIPVVSALDVNNNGIEDSEEGVTQEGLSEGDRLLGTYFTEGETLTSYPISSQANGAGCCLVSEDAQTCLTTTPSGCVSDSPFAEGALCAQTSFCSKGCCYSETTGIYDRNTLEVDCSAAWTDDPNCNMPEARRGCCVLDGISFFETYQQCTVRTESFAQGDGIVDWKGNLNAAECVILSATQKEGACVIGNGECKFGTESSCYGYDGEFNEGYLCTSPLLDTSCEITEQTTCVDGKDGVYFMDSCGNVANIYDSTRKDDPVYWDLIAAPEDICGDGDVDSGNANSVSCGNCNRFFGGICGSATEDNFNVDSGSFYCKDTSCMLDGVTYKNGESWCVYDGKIGEGDDVVGSRHWKYVCSQGTIQIEPCADYRNQICIQQNTFDVNGTEVEFRNANCVANNWRQCIDLNSEEDGLEDCEDTLNCRVEKVDIADKFKFDVCLPKYPGGFNLRDERYLKTSEGLCQMADQTCTVVYKPKTFGGCKLIANKRCLSETFAKEMNDFCTGLGDCGGAVNIEGVYSENYKVKESPYLSKDSINELMALAEVIPGQFAEVENYMEYLEAAGLFGGPEEEPEGEEVEDVDYTITAVGVMGIAYAVGVYATGSLALAGGAYTVYGTTGLTIGSTAGTSGLIGGASLSAYAGLGVGIAVGMIAGTMVAKQLGLSPAGSMMMAVAGGLAGAAVAIYFNFLGAAALCSPCAPFLIIAAIIIAIIATFFGGSDCDPVEVTFECNTWMPPVGGDDCEKCNNNPLKPCSEYRCNSLGTACELINKGMEDEMCYSEKDDGKTPILRPRLDFMSWTEMYDHVGADGFEITSLDGGCIDAYTPLVFGITTDELAYCKFDIQATEFDAMSYDLGSNAYLYNHTMTFTLPDPSHGQSQGASWVGDLTFYIKCQDVHGHETPDFYTIDMCVKEGDDITGPLIRATDPVENTMVGVDALSQNFTLVTNELATCKWDVADMEYSDMANSMVCNDTLAKQSSPLGYVCSDVLPVTNISNSYYIRCMDQPWLNESDERNANVGSFVYTLRKPAAKISIEKIAPTEDFEINTASTTVELKIQTDNGGDYHWCSYSFSGYDNMIKMFETGADTIHIQPFNRPAGRNKIYIQCEDETGDFIQGLTEFNIIRDSSTPQIARMWQSNGKLYIITTEEAECQYTTTSCRFNWGDGDLAGIGSEHTIDVVKGDTYYIKCEDEFGNAPAECSVEVRAL